MTGGGHHPLPKQSMLVVGHNTIVTIDIPVANYHHKLLANDVVNGVSECGRGLISEICS